MAFVIRAMSTTDLPECRPYHTYLLPPERRVRAYWTAHQYEAQQFPTALDATMEALRALSGNWDVAPLNDPSFPTFWGSQATSRAA